MGLQSLSSARPAFSLIVRGPSLGNQASECLCLYNISFLYSGADSPSVGLAIQFSFALCMHMSVCYVFNLCRNVGDYAAGDTMASDVCRTLNIKFVRCAVNLGVPSQPC